MFLNLLKNYKVSKDFLPEFYIIIILYFITCAFCVNEILFLKLKLKLTFF